MLVALEAGGGHKGVGREEKGPSPRPPSTHGGGQGSSSRLSRWSGDRRTKRDPNKQIVSGRREGGELKYCYGSCNVNAYVSRRGGA